MKISLTLSTLSYSGWSIGRNIRMKVEAQNKTAVWEKRIRPISFSRLDIPIGIIEVDEGQEISVKVTVIEKDLVFSDSGEKLLTLSVPGSVQLPETHAVTLEVLERRFVFWKTKAVFSVGIDMRVISEDAPVLRTYQSYGGEDYNRYDDIFSEVVAYWNDEFTRLTDAPDEPLDPNLVKAMAYQESHVGNNPKNNGYIDIIQVGNPNNPALVTLKGELREYWVHDTKLVQLKYPDAVVESVRDSVFWSVRWLYHKAHTNIKNDDGSWRTKWKPWQEAVHEYGPGVDEYVQNVWNIYTKGISERGGNTVKLWSFAGVLILGLLTYFWGGASDAGIRRSFAKQFPEMLAVYRIGIDVVRHEEDPSLFVAVEKDRDDWSEHMTVGRIKKGRINWFPNLPYQVGPSNVIISLRFLNIGGFDEPILEVWSKTHIWNGGIDLYRVGEDELLSVIHIYAFDHHFEDVFDPSGYPEYGGGYYSCSSIYKGEKLDVVYRDTDDDGVDEAVLTGVKQTFCQKTPDDNTRILAAEQPVEEIYELINLPTYDRH